MPPLENNAPQQYGELVELLVGIQKQLARYVRSLVPHCSDAEEVLQEVNLFLWNHAAEYEPGTNFAAWAFKVAHYHVLTFRKRQARTRRSLQRRADR